MTLSGVGPPDGDRRRDLRDRIGLVFGAGLALAALVGSVMVMARGGTRLVYDAAVGVVAHSSSQSPSSGPAAPGPDDGAGPADGEQAAPDELARTDGTTSPITISMVSMPVPASIGAGTTATDPAATGSTDDTGDGVDERGFGTVEVGTTPTKGTAAPVTAPPGTEPPATAPPPTAAATTVPPTTAAPTTTSPPPTAPPTTVASGPQLTSSLACQPTAANLRLDMFTGNGGEIRRVRITGFTTPGCNGAHFTLNFLDANGTKLMGSSGNLKAPGAVSQTVYLDVSGLGGANVKPSKVKKVEVKP